MSKRARTVFELDALVEELRGHAERAPGEVRVVRLTLAQRYTGRRVAVPSQDRKHMVLQNTCPHVKQHRKHVVLQNTCTHVKQVE